MDPGDRSNDYNKLPNMDINKYQQYLFKSLNTDTKGKEGVAYLGKVFSNYTDNVKSLINQIITYAFGARTTKGGERKWMDNEKIIRQLDHKFKTISKLIENDKHITHDAKNIIEDGNISLGAVKESISVARNMLNSMVTESIDPKRKSDLEEKLTALEKTTNEKLGKVIQEAKDRPVSTQPKLKGILNSKTTYHTPQEGAKESKKEVKSVKSEHPQNATINKISETGQKTPIDPKELQNNLRQLVDLIPWKPIERKNLDNQFVDTNWKTLQQASFVGKNVMSKVNSKLDSDPKLADTDISNARENAIKSLRNVEESLNEASLKEQRTKNQPTEEA